MNYGGRQKLDAHVKNVTSKFLWGCGGGDVLSVGKGGDADNFVQMQGMDIFDDSYFL